MLWISSKPMSPLGRATSKITKSNLKINKKEIGRRMVSCGFSRIEMNSTFNVLTQWTRFFYFTFETFRLALVVSIRTNLILIIIYYSVNFVIPCCLIDSSEHIFNAAEHCENVNTYIDFYGDYFFSFCLQFEWNDILVSIFVQMEKRYF